MKRFTIFFALLLMTCLTVSAAYKIELKDGTYIDADAKPVVKDDFAYFFKSGMYLYIASAKIDFQKTEKTNLEVAKEQPKTVTTPKVKKEFKPVFINDEDLELIRKRSHLANEEPSSSAQQDSQVMPSSGNTSPPDSDTEELRDVGSMRRELSTLLDQRVNYQERINDLNSRLQDLRNRFNFSAMQDDKERLQQEIDDTQAQIDDVKGQLDSMNANIQSLQQQIASTPVVVNPQEK